MARILSPNFPLHLGKLKKHIRATLLPADTAVGSYQPKVTPKRVLRCPSKGQG